MGGGEAALAHVAHQVSERVDRLLDAQRPVAPAEQAEGHQRDRSDRRGPVDADADLEGELLQVEALLVRVGLGRGLGRAGGLAKRHRLAEADVDLSVAPAQPARDPQEPAEALGFLGDAALLRGVVADVGDLIVGDGDREQVDVLALAAPVGVHHVGQQPELRREELAGAGAAPLDVELDREALLDQVVDVVVEDELVDLVVLEAPPDEEDAAAPHQRTQREEVHVDSASGVGGRKAVLVEHGLEHRVVEIGLVGGEKDHRVPLSESGEPLELLAVVLEHVAVASRVHELPELHHQVDHEGALAGGDLPEVARGLPGDGGLPALEAPREPGHAAPERRAGEDVLIDEAGHLVAVAAQLPLRPLQRQHRLARHEVGDPHRVADVGADRTLPAVPELGGGGWLARHDAAAVRGGSQQPVCPKRIRVSRIAELEKVREPGRTTALSLLGQPHHPQRRQDRVFARGECGLELRVGAPAPATPRGGNPEELDVAVVGALRQVALHPGPKQALLEAARRIEQEDDPLPSQRRPAGLVDPWCLDCRSHPREIVSQQASPVSGFAAVECGARRDESV